MRTGEGGGGGPKTFTLIQYLHMKLSSLPTGPPSRCLFAVWSELVKGRVGR